MSRERMVCDRCGAKYENYGSFEDSKLVPNMFSIGYDSADGDFLIHQEDRYLCPRCMRDLKTWFLEPAIVG